MMKKLLLFTIPILALIISCGPCYVGGYQNVSTIIIENRTAENIVISVDSNYQLGSVDFSFTDIIPYGYHQSSTAYSSNELFEGEESLMVRSISSIQFFDYEAYTSGNEYEREYNLIGDYTYLSATIEGRRKSYSADLETFFNPYIEDSKFLYGTTWESASDSLFVPSETRPFYIERDPDQSWVAKIIITHIPTPPEDGTTP